MASKIKKIEQTTAAAPMTEIVVDDGRRRVPIKNTLGEEIGSFTFAPTDIGIIERFNSAAEKFDEIAKIVEDNWVDDDAAATEDEALAGNLKALSQARERLNELIDYIFGGPASQAFFGSMNPFSPVGGRFYVEAALEAAGDYIGSQLDRESEAMSEKAKSYLKEDKK